MELVHKNMFFLVRNNCTFMWNRSPNASNSHIRFAFLVLRASGLGQLINLIINFYKLTVKLINLT